MTILAGDVLTQLAFSMYESKGVYAVLLGSGLSRAAEIPTGWEITLDLIRRVALTQGIEEQPDWAAWYHQKTGKAPDYSTLLAELAVSAEERRAILHRYIEPTEEDRAEGRKVPTAAHRAIAQLVQGGYVKVIVTTNFDRLMESALRELGIEPTVVASVDALAGAEPLSHSKCYVLKLHGDYKDARILNTEEELSKYPKKYDGLLDRIFDEYGLVVSGWSGNWDHALRAAMLRAPNRRYPVFWATRSTPADSAMDLIKHRGAQRVSIADADGFFTGLQRRIETLAQVQRQNPLSIELLISSTKRFLAKPEYRIQLDELVTEEAQRVLSQLDSDWFSPQGPWDQAAFRVRVQRYEAITESLATMAGVLGRWGTGSELPVVLDLIRTLWAHAEKIGSGLTVLLGLRSYPAVLVFTAYGLGATRAERWDALHNLLNAMVDREHREPKRAVEELFLGAWKGAQGDIWKQLEGLDRRKTALSDHLLEVFTVWSKPFVGLVPDFEMLFERFELLASLSHFETNDKASVKQELQTNSHQSRIWTPIGRSGWHESTAATLLSELMTDPMKAKLLEAKFAKGDAEFMELFTKNFARLAWHMRW